jgi:hypothetical protein
MNLGRRLDRVEQQLGGAAEAALAGLPPVIQVTIGWVRLLQHDLGVDEDEALREAAKRLEVDEEEFAAAMREYLEAAGL